jgi:hypothetical protein
MLIDTRDSRLHPREREALIRIGARLARDNGERSQTATEQYARMKCLPYIHHRVDAGDK